MPVTGSVADAATNSLHAAGNPRRVDCCAELPMMPNQQCQSIEATQSTDTSELIIWRKGLTSHHLHVTSVMPAVNIHSEAQETKISANFTDSENEHETSSYTDNLVRLCEKCSAHATLTTSMYTSVTSFSPDDTATLSDNMLNLSRIKQNGGSASLNFRITNTGKLH